jgi:hypothetical protein
MPGWKGGNEALVVWLFALFEHSAGTNSALLESNKQVLTGYPRTLGKGSRQTCKSRQIFYMMVFTMAQNEKSV